MKEDFVGYDLAVKLKEKGFCEHVRGHYKSKCHLSVCSEPMNCNGSASGDISAPQIHEVLKWLREEKKIHISTMLFMFSKGWCYEIVQIGENPKLITTQRNSCDTYEQAALAGIEYVIDNLI